MDIKLIFLPVIGAIIGWLTNYLAIKMLFKPYKPVKILGFTIHGVLPKRREVFAHKIALTIEKELLSSKDISAILEGSGWEDEVENSVEEIVNNTLNSEGIKKFPLVGLLSDSILTKIKFYMSKEIIKQVDKRKPQLLDKFHSMVDVKKIVSTKVDNFDINKLETIIFSVVEKELRHIEITGAILGFMIGIIQVLLVKFL